MIRAGLAALLLATPAGAATLAECESLTTRLPLEIETTQSIAGVCLFSNVRLGLGQGQATWRAERITLGGDIDALPDALPTRLSGGVVGLAIVPEIPDQPAMNWLFAQQAGPGMSITFDINAEAGVLNVNTFRFAMNETNEITLSARMAGVPEVWPVDPVAAAAVQLQAMDVEIAFDGLFEGMFLLPLGTAVLDLEREAEPQVTALRETVATFLSAFAETDQAENAQNLQAFVDALPQPRGLLSVRFGGSGLSAVQAIPLATGAASPDFIARVADAAELVVTWSPTE